MSFRLATLTTVGSFIVWLSSFQVFSEAAETNANRLNFNRDVRPILSENCFYCHGQDANQRQADLRLDDREDAVASGAITPGNVQSSSLIHRIHQSDPDSLMPPPSSNRRLTDSQKQTLERWIGEGANYDIHWAFTKPERPALPNVVNKSWPRNPIDYFVLSKLEAAGIQPSPEADRSALIKRLYSDLIGLPPSLEEIDQFLNDSDPNAYENLVDRLMNSQHYGERMSLPWLDAARYADSNGFQQDGDSWQWMWRDWVVRALNDNLPFDQFTIWQLAGDLLPDATLDQKIASGFNRNHLLNGEGGAIPEEQRYVILFDRMDTTATTFLGLTMSCAQCHDHKYDPLTQRDYYSLMDVFNRVPETGVPQYFSKRIRVGNPFIEVPDNDFIQKRNVLDARIDSLSKEAQPLLEAAYQGWRLGLLADGKPAEGKGLGDDLVALLSKNADQCSEDDRKAIELKLRQHFDKEIRNTLKNAIPKVAELDAALTERSELDGDQMPRPMIMSDANPRDTYILIRGEYLNPGEKVTMNTPVFLPPMRDEWPRNRLGLAYWLLSEDQPLTSRVQVNRLWQHFFGAGIVKTSEDFGVQSEYPVHLDLLNWLAVDFREGGWDMKRLNRLIVTSATYRQSSRITPESKSLDPENRLYGRATRMRMPAMVLRDWALASSDLINLRVGGKPVYPYQPEGIWESLAITNERDFTYPASTGEDLYRRSLYTFWRRTVGPANMFDASSRQTCKVRLAITSTPLHALTTLNDPTWVEAARKLAEAALHRHTALADQLQYAFRRVTCRPLQPSELDRLTQAWQKQVDIFSQDTAAANQFLSVGAADRDQTLDPVSHAAMAAVCLAIFNLDEALTRE